MNQQQAEAILKRAMEMPPVKVANRMMGVKVNGMYATFTTDANGDLPPSAQKWIAEQRTLEAQSTQKPPTTPPSGG